MNAEQLMRFFPNGAGVQAMTPQRNLYVWGENIDFLDRSGFLGLGDDYNAVEFVDSPTRSGEAIDWHQASSGAYMSVAINKAGEMYSWGWNKLNTLRVLLGLGDDYNNVDFVNSPTRIGTASNWTFVSAGYAHSLAINSDGELYVWGWNKYGSLGLGDGYMVVNSPTRIGTASNWVFASVGEFSSFAINSDGELYSWGTNSYGMLGLGDANVVRNIPTRVGTASNWTFVSCWLHTLMINADGELYACGRNDNGQLGLGAYGPYYSPTRVGTATNWKSASCGFVHSLLVNEDGELFSCGENTAHQLGNGIFNVDVLTPEKIADQISWESCSASYYSSFAVNASGELYAWGRNNNYELGLGSNSSANYPTQVGSSQKWKSVNPRKIGIGIISNE